MESVIVFDGYCNLCNGWVSFLLARDPQGHFRFATLQSDVGQALIHRVEPLSGDGESVVLVEDGRVHTKSSAVLRILRRIGPPWSAAAVLLLIPRPIRDAVYGIVARNRYRWFGRLPACRVPTDEERGRFL